MSGSKGKVQALDFIIYNGAPTNSDPAIRSRVRSHVTRLQHRKDREKKKHGSAGSLQRLDGSAAELNEKAVCASSAEPSLSVLNSAAGSTGPSRSSTVAQCSTGTWTTRRPLNFQRFPRWHAVSVSTGHLVRSAMIASDVSRQLALQDPGDQMAHILADLDLNFSIVLEHYKWIVFVQSPHFERIFMPNDPRGSGYEIFTSALVHDPALVRMAILIATEHIMSIRNKEMSPNVARCILGLKTFVLKAVNEALNVPERATSNALICAVLILASHEGLQGSTENFHVHMRGLVQMINLRGGLSRLNETQKLFEEYIVWQETNVSAIMQCEPYWKQTKEHSKGLPVVDANPAMWLLKEV